jgi:hypothetical protein
VLFYANDILGYLRGWWGIKLVAWLGLAWRGGRWGGEGRVGGGYLGFGFGFALTWEKVNNTMQPYLSLFFSVLSRNYNGNCIWTYFL